MNDLKNFTADLSTTCYLGIFESLTFRRKYHWSLIQSNRKRYEPLRFDNLLFFHINRLQSASLFQSNRLNILESCWYQTELESWQDYDHESNPWYDRNQTSLIRTYTGSFWAHEITKILSQFEGTIMVMVSLVMVNSIGRPAFGGLSTVIWNDFTWLFWFQPRVILATSLVKRIGRFGWFWSSINLNQSFNYGLTDTLKWISCIGRIYFDQKNWPKDKKGVKLGFE